MANKALINFYARVIRKEQKTIEDVEPELREAVRVRIAELEAEDAQKESGES